MGGSGEERATNSRERARLREEQYKDVCTSFISCGAAAMHFLAIFIHPDRRDVGGEVGREGKLEARLVLDRPRGGKREMAWFNGHPRP